MASKKATKQAEQTEAPAAEEPRSGKRQVVRHEFIVEASEPIAHMSGSLGNHGIFMRRKIRQPGGRFVSVPFITGDSIRHQLREAAAYATLEAAGMSTNAQLSEGALRLLFNGGMVTGKGDASTINLDAYRRLVRLFPPLALFGGCTDNRPIPGQLCVDEGLLICAETWHMVKRDHAWAVQWLESQGESEHVGSFREQLEEAQRVRMDAMLRPEKVRLLSDSARANVEGRALTSERAHETGDAKAAGESKSAMLPRTYERLAVGALFVMGVEARTYDDLEYDACLYIIGCALNGLRLGGMGRTGHGRVRFRAGARLHFQAATPNIEATDTHIAGKVGDLYRAHVAAHAEELKAWLRGGVNS